MGSSTDMGLNYVMESGHIVDYDVWKANDIDFILRGPRPVPGAETPRIAFVGSAATFGVFVSTPFPTLLGEMLSCQVLNLGRGGAGPGFFARSAGAIRMINQSTCAVVQVMSGRSSLSNSAMESVEGLASVVVKVGSNAGRKLLGDDALRAIGKELADADLAQIYDESIGSYLRQYQQLFDRIEVPTVLLYLGKVPPNPPPSTMEEKATSVREPGSNPHLVDAHMLQILSAYTEETAVVIDDSLRASRLVNRFTGCYEILQRPGAKRLERNNVYASPYMHAKAALALYGPLSRLIAEAD